MKYFAIIITILFVIRILYLLKYKKEIKFDKKTLLENFTLCGYKTDEYYKSKCCRNKGFRTMNNFIDNNLTKNNNYLDKEKIKQIKEKKEKECNELLDYWFELYEKRPFSNMPLILVATLVSLWMSFFVKYALTGFVFLFPVLILDVLYISPTYYRELNKKSEKNKINTKFNSFDLIFNWNEIYLTVVEEVLILGVIKKFEEGKKI